MLSQLLISLTVTIFLYILPGNAILRILVPRQTFSWVERIGLSAGLSLSIYPLLALWLYVLGIAPGAMLAWLPGSVVLLLIVWQLFDRARGTTISNLIQRVSQIQFYNGVGILVILILAYIRLLPVQEMTAPAWGDSVHHTTIVQLMLDHGGLFKSWAPYAPMRSFTYHFGYHIAIACWSWVSGMNAVQSVIVGSQMINLLAIIALYPITVKLARGNHYAGIGALLVAGFFTQLPAFYVNWGRYTQLAAQVILPVFIYFLDDLLLGKEKPKPSHWIALVFVSSGLMLTHYRIAVVAAAAALAWVIWAIWIHRDELWSWSRRLWGLVTVAVIALLAVLPWLIIIRSGRLLLVTGAISSRATGAAANVGELGVWQSPDTYYPYFLWQATIFVLLISLWKRHDLFIRIGLWCGFSFLAASPFLIGLPGTGLVTNFLLIVGAYIVIAITIGCAFGWFSSIIFKAKAGYWLWGGVCFVLISVGSFSQRQIIDPFYQLVDENDVRSFTWIRQNIPDNAHFLVNGFLAYSDKLVVGADAGWWLPLYTQREATVPPILYSTEVLAPEMDRTFYRQLLLDIRETQGESQKLHQVLCLAEITHVFLGEKQGQGGVGAESLVPVDWLRTNTDFTLLHQDGEAQIWQFDRSKCESKSVSANVGDSLDKSPDDFSQDDFSQNEPIWVSNNSPSHSQVALFRKNFFLEKKIDNATLRIFADTRYEVWLDSIKIGRGPARFSKTRHEYDIAALGEIDRGDHTIATLVQWAPNTRRSESTKPHLIVDLQGIDETQQKRTIVQTNSSWKAIISDAWRMDAAPVHSWNLLGPTELIDFRQLPARWTSTDYQDNTWHQVVKVALQDEIHYAARSIPLLKETRMPISLIDSGLLSPEGYLLQYPPLTHAITLPFEVSSPTTVTVESLIAIDTQQPVSVTLDGVSLQWLPADAKRPDVVSTQAYLLSNHHILSFEKIDTTIGFPFLISKNQVNLSQFPFEQSNHAGRRLLLAKPLQDPATIKIEQTSDKDTLDLHIYDAPSYIVIDLGRVVVGRLTARVSGPEGTVIDIGWDERLYPDTLRPLPHPGSLHKEWNQVDSWILGGTARRLTTLDARSGRYIILAVWGKTPVEIDSLQILEELYPVQQIGWFRSSDSLLNRIWEIGVNSAKISMQDAYADAWRERGQWWGDAYIVDHVNQVVFGDTQLLRRGLIFLGDSFKSGQPTAFAPNGDGTQLFDYSMLWAQSLADYLRRTEDKETVIELYPHLNDLLSFLKNHRNANTGLLDIPPGHWSETALVDWAGSKSRTGQSTALNSLYYKTLLDAAYIASLIDKEQIATQLEKEAGELKQAINLNLFQSSSHHYVSSIVDSQLVTPTTHAQAWPLALGVTEKSEASNVVKTLLQSFQVEIFGMYWVLEGLANANRTDLAVELIRQKYGRLIELGATTWWEGWNDYLNYRGALSHGWGASPTWFLSTHLLGAQRTGLNTWLIAPAFSGVDWVKGAIPFQNLELGVRWQIHNCSRIELEIDAPIGSSGTVRLPFSAIENLKIDGKAVWSNNVSLSNFSPQFINDGIQFDLMGGNHQVLIELYCNFMPVIFTP